MATPKASEKRNAEATEEAPAKKKRKKDQEEEVVEQPSSTVPNQEENEVIQLDILKLGLCVVYKEHEGVTQAYSYRDDNQVCE